MAPKKLKLDEVVEVYVRVMGGEVAAASALAPKIGPLGISPKKVGEEIAKETAKEWKGIRVTVKIRVENRETKVSVVPSAAALLKKQIKDRGNLSLGNVVEIAEVMRGRSLAKELAGTVMEMLGTCVSLGCTVDARYPKDLQLQISNGQLLLPVA